MSRPNNFAQMSTSNMSGIKQSIQEYSMDFQNSNQAISEIISMSRTGKNVSMSKGPATKKSSIQIIDDQNKRNPKPLMKYTQQQVINEQQINGKQNSKIYLEYNKKQNQAVFLGQNVFQWVRQRYREIQGTETNDPDVLFQFYKRQRKNTKTQTINFTIQDLGVLMPSAQRKLMLKIQFQKILSYYPQDVYFTLVCGSEKLVKDTLLNTKMLRLDAEMKKRPESKKKNIEQIVDRLYQPKGSNASSLKLVQTITKPKQMDARQKRKIFGNRLREVYENHFRNNPDPPLQTHDKMYEFWQDMYERDEYGLQWSQLTIKQDIKLYMMEQVQDLQAFLQKKLGFKQLKGQDLYKFYLKNMPIQGINIPLASMKQYLKAYNEIIEQRSVQQHNQQVKRQKQVQKRQKQREIKKFGRPVSATPISVLSKAKASTNFENIAQKYSTDKFLSTLLHADKMKVARHPFQYGIYNLEEEVKVKGRVKIEEGVPYDKAVFKMLNQTFTNKNFFNVKQQDRVRELIGQDDIEKPENWKQLGPVLQQAIIVKAYENDWFRDALLRYCAKTVQKDLKFSDDKTVVLQMMKYFNSLSEDDRKDQLGNLDNVISTSQTIAQRTEQIKKLSVKGQNATKKQKQLFYSFLQTKACEFMQNRIKRKQVNLRKFLNDIFQIAMKDYKQFTTKFFNVLRGQKECPKLLKYQFFRLQKQINPFTNQRQLNPKCHAWIPTKSMPQNFNYKTFNTYAVAYQKNKNKIVSKPQQQKHQNSIWGYKKQHAKEREALLMSYDDAQQCVFQPRISRVK